MRVMTRRTLLVLLPLLLAFAGCSGPVTMPVVAGSDFTFLVAADAHYGQSMWDNNEASNKANIDRMNALPGTAWPIGVETGAVASPVGVLVVGDLTDSGAWLNWNGYRLLHPHDGFREDFGVGGEGRVKYPVFESYGNHDITNGRTVVINGIKERNRRREGLNLSGNGLHSSWDWGKVHFVNLNLYPGGPGNANDSLAFLKDDLAQRVGNSRRPVILFHHYGFDSFSCEERWWTEAEREAYYAAIKDYNIVAIFNGHLHGQGHLQWHGIDAFIAGKAADGNFLVVHISADRMTVAGRTQQGWGECWSKTFLQ
jgi:cytolysin (calcineurin-like family phosphatase)